MTSNGHWVREAIAEQEEHIKRQQSCGEVRFRAHKFVPFRPSGPVPAGIGIPASVMWSACLVCGVTRTSEDYRTKMDATGTGRP